MVTARTAVLQALRRGPAYGRLLMRRVGEATHGRASLAPGSVYPALRSLERARLVRRWTVVAGRARGGRSRAYYELTAAGAREAESDALALAALVAPAVLSPPPDPEAMRERLERVSELLDFAVHSGEALARARRRS